MNLDEATNFDTTGYRRMETRAQHEKFMADELLPRYSPMLRTPLPPNESSPDAQRNFYLGNKIPQYRIAKPIEQAPTGNITTTVNISSATSTSIASSSSSPLDQTAGYVTASLDVGSQEQGSIVMAKTVTIKRITVDNPARVRLYSTNDFQIIDADRAIDSITELNGTQHGVIMDLELSDTLSWTLSPAAVGGNCDDPDTNVLYITVDNIGSLSGPITVSINYVGEES